MLGLTKLEPGAGSVALSERPEREPGAGEVVLEVRAAGICGTDLHIEDGEFPSVPPVTMGHEVCGVVLAGDGAEPGARVVSETYFSTCGTCGFCRAGRPNLCPERRSIGSQVDGAFAAAPRRPRSEPALDPRLAARSRRHSRRAARLRVQLAVRPAGGRRGRRGARGRPRRRRSALRAGGAGRRRSVSSSSAPSATVSGSTWRAGSGSRSRTEKVLFQHKVRSTSSSSARAALRASRPACSRPGAADGSSRSACAARP